MSWMGRRDEEESEMDETEFHEHHARKVPPSCTDVPCLLVFLCFVVGMGCTLAYGIRNGDMRKLSHSIDYTGALCGVDAHVKTMPYLYVCLKPNSNTELALEFPICATACPDSDQYTLMCPQYSDGVVGPVPIPSYPTTALAERWCIPQAAGLKAELFGDVGFNSWFNQATVWTGSLKKGWPVLLTVFLLALLLFGPVFVSMLHYCAGPFVYGTLAAVIFGALILGTFLTYSASAALSEPATKHVNESLGVSRTTELYIGYALLVVGITFSVALCCCCRKALQTAIAIVEESCNVIVDMPALLMQPVVLSIVKLATLIFLVWGLLLLVSCAELVTHGKTPGALTGKGMYRLPEPSQTQEALILFWLLGLFWTMELQVAIGLFTLSYSVVLWYYTPKDANGDKDAPSSTFPLTRGLRFACTYHLGSLAFGSFIIGLIRWLQALLDVIAKGAETHSGGPANAVVTPLLCCAHCILECCKHTLEFVNKNAYIDIAINSNNFCPACRNVVVTLFTHAGKFAILNGVAALIANIGVALITILGIFTSLLLVNLPIFADEASLMYLDSPFAVVAVSGLISFLVANLFMIVFDQVADTILYCYVVSMNDNTAAAYAPDSLVEIMDTESYEIRHLGPSRLKPRGAHEDERAFVE